MAKPDIGDLDAKLRRMGLGEDVADEEWAEPECLKKEDATKPETQPALIVAEDDVPVALVKSGAQLTKRVEEMYLAQEVEEVHDSNAETKHDGSDVTKSPTLSTGHLHRLVDSPQENANSSSAAKMYIARLHKELRQTKNEPQESSARNDELSKDFEGYKALFNFTKQLLDIGKATTLEKELEACHNKLGKLKAKNQYFEQRNNEQRYLDGRCFSSLHEDIRIHKKDGDEKSREVTISIVFTFPKRTYLSNGYPMEQQDDCAVGYMRFKGYIYLARSGTQGDPTGFINRNHWTTAAEQLANLVGISNIERGYASHVEPQLMAFYITGMLEESGNRLKHFGEPHTFQRHSDLKIPIDIYVSQEICWSCSLFIDKVNVVMLNHGLSFRAVNAGSS
ncbi:hypothetical protein TUN199_09382 [Pyrenophora tritici-repentis]|uniref:Uncharacterized protein n=1 Tax=Pyrenophora tritici-repentis TaxID=45151 RepID=A0A2W1DCM8_9PLEO|nr:hypothetical protein A1F99_123250 [Pyrenophora tritici-repentis]KAF7568726.1 hypothetical protein PtrM4_133390 [Pyrenophora tritici-repentis]KAI0575300.1 hypothetical protein Alg130_09313 [Pyrenophora tritici-repentis]KAI0606524.1 hypothetical protein TUN205_09221 [Pyrenophora tritici-repentis]KAI0618619.1 hypothetical protein TUN199_09382 [Pyrenophora tritici-repentis]